MEQLRCEVEFGEVGRTDIINTSATLSSHPPTLSLAQGSLNQNSSPEGIFRIKACLTVAKELEEKQVLLALYFGCNFVLGSLFFFYTLILVYIKYGVLF